MSETVVSYHADGYGPARPAINVKLHVAGYDLWPDSWRTFPEGPALADRHVEIAYERTQERFWADAEAVAEGLGLGPIVSEGRSGGWLVLTDGRDPRDMSGGEYREPADEDPNDPWVAGAIRERNDWLAAYYKLADWCDQELAAIPARIASLAQQLAMDEIGREPAERMFAPEIAMRASYGSLTGEPHRTWTVPA